MGIIQRIRSWEEQPSDSLELHPDWSERVASMILFGPGGPMDIVNRANYVANGSASLGIRQSGDVLITGASSNDYIEASGALAQYSGYFTVICYLPEIASDTGPNGGMLWSIPASSIWCQLHSSGQYIYNIGYGSLASLGENVLGTKNRTIAFRSGSTNSVFVDRKRIDTGAVTLPSGGKTVRIGQWTDTSLQFKGAYGKITVLVGDITDDEIYAYVDNPWVDLLDRRIVPTTSTVVIPTLSSPGVSSVTHSGATPYCTLSF